MKKTYIVSIESNSIWIKALSLSDAIQKALFKYRPEIKKVIMVPDGGGEIIKQFSAKDIIEAIHPVKPKTKVEPLLKELMKHGCIDPECIDQANEIIQAHPVKEIELDAGFILAEALIAGFSISTTYGQIAPKLMPTSDKATLIKFAKAICQAAEKERNG